MKTITIPELALKMFGLVLIVLGLPKIPWMLYWLACVVKSTQLDSGAVGSLTHSASGVCYIVLGLLIFASSRPVSRRFIIRPEQTSDPLTPQALQDTLYSCVGLFIALRSVPAIVSFIVMTTYRRHHGIVYSPGGLEPTIGIGAIVTFLLGVSVFLGAKGLVAFRNHVRNLGARRQS